MSAHLWNREQSVATASSGAGQQRFPARARFRGLLFVPAEQDDALHEDPLLRAIERLRATDDTVFRKAAENPLPNPGVANALRRMDDRLHWLRNLLDQSAESVTSYGVVDEKPVDATVEPDAILERTPKLTEPIAQSPEPHFSSQELRLEQLLHDYFSEWRLMSEDEERDPSAQLQAFAHSIYMEQLLQHFQLPFLLLSQDLRILQYSLTATRHLALKGLQLGSSLATRLRVSPAESTSCLLSDEDGATTWSIHCCAVGNGRLVILPE